MTALLHLPRQHCNGAEAQTGVQSPFVEADLSRRWGAQGSPQLAQRNRPGVCQAARGWCAGAGCPGWRPAQQKGPGHWFWHAAEPVCLIVAGAGPAQQGTYANCKNKFQKGSMCSLPNANHVLTRGDEQLVQQRDPERCRLTYSLGISVAALEPQATLAGGLHGTRVWAGWMECA